MKFFIRLIVAFIVGMIFYWAGFEYKQVVALIIGIAFITIVESELDKTKDRNHD